MFEIAPSTRFFTSNDFIEFINYHYNNGTKDFTSENLVYPVDNLQKLLSEKLISYTELNKILSSFPNTNRNIGTLPKDWGLSDDISKQDKIFDLINKYTQDNSIEDLQQGLVSILDKNVKIQYLGRGAYGKVLKIEIDNAEPVVLKTFLTLERFAS